MQPLKWHFVVVIDQLGCFWTCCPMHQIAVILYFWVILLEEVIDPWQMHQFCHHVIIFIISSSP
jgi:hypothetical protein